MGDDVECRSVEKLFNTRDESLLIGSLKSNMGHSEVTAGLCSLVKALLIFKKDTIPANLHFNPIDQTIPGIKTGKLKVSYSHVIKLISFYYMEINAITRFLRIYCKGVYSNSVAHCVRLHFTVDNK